MTKHSRIISTGSRLAVLALAIAATGSAVAANAIATSTSVVVAPIDITKTTDLSFGSFAVGATPGSVTVSPNGNRGVTGGVTGMAGATTAALFSVTGQTGSTYTITVTGTDLTSGANSMAFTPVSDLSASAITSGTVAGGTLSGTAQSLYVGGVLTVAANQAPGTYTGQVSATVEYN